MQNPPQSYHTLKIKKRSLIPCYRPSIKINYVILDNLFLQSSNKEKKLEVLLEFWEKLASVKQLNFNAKTNSKAASEWNGKGEVISTRNGSDVLIFNEKGTWAGKQGVDVSFSNVFRWTLDRDAQMISLEHLRYGSLNPVFLFHLTPSGNHSLSSVDPHLCGEDTYFGQIHFDSHSIQFNWKVIGPKKNEELN